MLSLSLSLREQKFNAVDGKPVDVVKSPQPSLVLQWVSGHTPLARSAGPSGGRRSRAGARPPPGPRLSGRDGAIPSPPRPRAAAWPAAQRAPAPTSGPWPRPWIFVPFTPWSRRGWKIEFHHLWSPQLAVLTFRLRVSRFLNGSCNLIWINSFSELPVMLSFHLNLIHT